MYLSNFLYCAGIILCSMSISMGISIGIQLCYDKHCKNEKQKRLEEIIEFVQAAKKNALDQDSILQQVVTRYNPSKSELVGIVGKITENCLGCILDEDQIDEYIEKIQQTNKIADFPKRRFLTNE